MVWHSALICTRREIVITTIIETERPSQNIQKCPTLRSFPKKESPQLPSRQKDTNQFDVIATTIINDYSWCGSNNYNSISEQDSPETGNPVLKRSDKKLAGPWTDLRVSTNLLWILSPNDLCVQVHLILPKFIGEN